MGKRGRNSKGTIAYYTRKTATVKPPKPKTKAKAAFDEKAFRNNLKKNERLEDYERLYWAVIDRDFSKNSDLLTYHVETALHLDLIGVEEITPMASAINEDLYNNDSELIQSILITSACDNAPHEIRNLIISRSKKAYQILNNAHTKLFSMMKNDKLPNGFMGWKRFPVSQPKNP